MRPHDIHSCMYIYFYKSYEYHAMYNHLTSSTCIYDNKILRYLINSMSDNIHMFFRLTYIILSKVLFFLNSYIKYLGQQYSHTSCMFLTSDINELSYSDFIICSSVIMLIHTSYLISSQLNI